MDIAMIGDAGYKIFLFFHILAVVLAFGPTFGYGFLFTVLPRYPRAAPALIEGMRRIDRYLVNPGMVVVLVAGILVLATSGSVWKGSQFFVVWGFIAIIALFGVQHGFVGPQMARLQEIAERDTSSGGDALGPEFESTSEKIGQVGMATGLLVVVTIFVMAYKPFL